MCCSRVIQHYTRPSGEKHAHATTSELFGVIIQLDEGGLRVFQVSGHPKSSRSFGGGSRGRHRSRSRRRSSTYGSETNYCTDCGYAAHTAGRPLCPAIGKECKACNSVGHFAAVCPTAKGIPNQGCRDSSTSSARFKYSSVPPGSNNYGGIVETRWNRWTGS